MNEMLCFFANTFEHCFYCKGLRMFFEKVEMLISDHFIKVWKNIYQHSLLLKSVKSIYDLSHSPFLD